MIRRTGRSGSTLWIASSLYHHLFILLLLWWCGLTSWLHHHHQQQRPFGVVEAQREYVFSSWGQKWLDWRRQQSSRKGAGEHAYTLSGGTSAPSEVQVDQLVSMTSLTGSVDLSFEGLRLTLDTKKKKKTQVILNGSLRGRARPGRMLAIMGPSGAGKSTVLHALAGRIQDDGQGGRLSGQRYINGQAVAGDSLLPAALVEQEVNFFPHMTVKETLDFRVALKLGSTLRKKERDAMVQDLLQQLSLTGVQDTMVGDAKVRGISGGERKRLSIAVEMISSPSLILLDEPTSGLDSTSATSLVETLRELADNGKTIVAVIHQPSQHVFAKFDDLLLVSEGKQMYFGERQQVRSYMSTMGYTAPEEMGTAEHILDCISRLPLEGESDQDAADRIDRLAAQAQAATIDLGKATKPEPNGENNRSKGRNGGNGLVHYRSILQGGPQANIFVQFGLLLKRSFREVTRGKAVFMVKLVQQISMAFIYGGIYSFKNDQSSIQDRFGFLSLCAIGSCNLAIAQTIRAFPKEKAIVAKELSSNMYRTLPYFIGKALAEIPMGSFFVTMFGSLVYRLTGLSRAAGKFQRFLGILTIHSIVAEAMGLAIGAVSPTQDVALALFPAVLILNVIFDGKNIAEENIPRLLRWIPKVGLIRWGFEALCVNEFEGLEFVVTDRPRGPVAKTGAEALARFGLGKRTLAEIIRAQLIVTGSAWLVSYLGLTLTRQRFLPMRVPFDDKK